jgi:ferric-dicitrate binding protein FerR (iron transport regulator)
MDDLLVKHLLRETTPEETRTVEEWLAAAPDNRHYYEQLQLIWEKSLHLTPSTLMETKDDTEHAWQTLRNRLHKPARPKPVIPLPWAVAIAAAILLPILVLTLWPIAPKMQTLSSNNSIINDTLPDGTTVTINKHSTLTRPAKAGKRTVHLQGEAFFQVAKDKDHPFELTSNGINITVLGTSFNVRTDSTSTDVAVETGQIRVANFLDTITLNSGESITLKAKDQKLQKHSTPAAIHNYYHPNLFQFQETPLPKLTAALQDAYKIQIVIADNALNTYKFTGTFRDEPLSRIMAVIAKSLQITAEPKGDTIILKK